MERGELDAMKHQQDDHGGHEHPCSHCGCDNKNHHHEDHQERPVHIQPHLPEELFGESGEVPAVFSQVLPMEFSQEISGYNLCTYLTNWLVSLTRWASKNKCFIGHIKIFAEDGESFHLWLSTTGGKINVKKIIAVLTEQSSRVIST